MGKINNRYKFAKDKSNYTTNHFSCNNCIAKLYNNDEECIYAGLGYIGAETMIIYPTYISVNQKLFDKLTDIICDAFRDKYSLHALDRLYITPSIKCFCIGLHKDMISPILEKCAIKTVSEISKLGYIRNIIYLGDSLDIEFLLQTNKYHKFPINCPYKIFNDDKVKDKFINELFNVLKYII